MTKSTLTGLRRRDFLKRVGLATPVFWTGFPVLDTAVAKPSSSLFSTPRLRELAADLVIIGGGLGGCAAALAAARNGLKVILTEETDWIGGQWTAQVVPPDENKWIETFGGTRSYQQLREGVRQYYRQHYPLTAKARAEKYLNPGNCWVSRIGCEPRVALAVLNELFALYLSSGQVRILLNHKAVDAQVTGDRVQAIRVLDQNSGSELVLHAPFFADATEQGDLLPLTKTEYVIGAEAQKDTGEPDAKSEAQPGNLQGFTACFVMDYLSGENHVIDRPRDYAYWRDFVVNTPPEKSYRLLSFDRRDSKKIGFDPVKRAGYWTYRRIADRDLFAPGFYPGDATIVNWPQNDFSFGLICDVDEATAAKNLDRAKQLSLSLLYWLQTDAPRPDGGTGWPGLRLRPDLVGTQDGLGKYPYIREGRRIRAQFTVLEQHVLTKLRMQETGLKENEVTTKKFPDTVGIGSYRMDLHLTTTGDHAIFGSTLPFQIPLGALIPQRLENLLPACKNIGVTHLTNGCYRLHPIEWNIGEAVGTLTAFCLAQKKQPREVRAKIELLQDFQKLLQNDGVRLDWLKDDAP